MENTSDYFMTRPLLFCMKSEKSVCYSVPDNNLRLLPFRNACMAQDNLEAHYDKNGSSYNENAGLLTVPSYHPLFYGCVCVNPDR